MTILDSLTPLPDVPVGMTDGVDGWLTGDEEKALFALGRLASGFRILEIGPWLGRSTICIARGILASGKRTEFTTCELNPTEANFVLEDGVRLFTPDLTDAPLGGSPEADYEANMAPVVEHPDGVIGKLRENIINADVAPLVQIVEGDFRFVPFDGRFLLIFSDAMHGPDEIRRNAPRLAELLAPGGILACHDTTPENREVLGEFFTFRDEVQIDSLFIGLVD